MYIDLESEIENIRVIDQKRDYWLIRTFGGALFETFIDEKFIGIGFNDVPYEYIRGARNEKNSTFSKLKEFLEKNYDLKKSEVTKWANQLVSFEFDVKIGDVIIVPSEGSNYLSIGVVKSKTKLEKSNRTFRHKNKKYEPIPEKRKQIEWIKPFSKASLFGDVTGLFSSHLAVTNANKFSEIIESNLSSVFIKDEKIYISIRINQDHDINAFALKDFLDCLTFFYKEFCADQGIDVHDDGLFIKIKVQSKGGAILKTSLITAGTFIAGLIMFTASDPNIKVKLENKFELEVSSKGSILDNISKFFDNNQERKHKEILFRDSLDRLKASTSSPVNNIVDTNHNEVDTITNKPK